MPEEEKPSRLREIDGKNYKLVGEEKTQKKAEARADELSEGDDGKIIIIHEPPGFAIYREVEPVPET